MTISIVTASFFTKLPADMTRVSVARSAPRRQSGYRTYRKLAPGSWFSSVSVTEYRRRYSDEVLAGLSAAQVVRDLAAMTDTGKVALLCWETAHDGQFCHRGLISEWLFAELGLEVVEYERPEDGFSTMHPKIPKNCESQQAIKKLSIRSI